MPLTQVDQGLLGPFAQYTGFKNRIINGAMMIDQRNAGASVTVNTGNQTWSVDRWFAQGTASSGVFTVQQSSVAPAGFTRSLLATVTTVDSSLAATDLYLLSQSIEGFNIADFAWGTANAQSVTLSFWVRSSVTGTFGGAIVNSAVNRSYPFSYTISSANTWEQKSITVAGDTSGTWLTDNGIGFRVYLGLGLGSTYSGTAGTWSGSFFISATGATNLMTTNGATFYITGVQLEKGSTATSFDYRPYGTELALCQRYYQATTVLVYSSSFARNFVMYPVQMRTSPTIAGGGSGFTTSVSSNAGTAMEQTSAASQNLTFSAEL